MNKFQVKSSALKTENPREKYLARQGTALLTLDETLAIRAYVAWKANSGKIPEPQLRARLATSLQMEIARASKDDMNQAIRQRKDKS